MIATSAAKTMGADQSATPLTPLPVLPRISVRLTASQLLLAKPGLVRMVESIERVRGGDFPNPFLPADFFLPKLGSKFIPREQRADIYECMPLQRPNRPKDDSILADKVMHLWKQVWPVFHGRNRQRLHLDFLELSICQLAVRALRKQVSHHHFDAPRPNYRQASKQLLRVLERIRRRAHAAALRELGKEQCAFIAKRWRSYIRWLRQLALSCQCGRKGVKHLQQFEIEEVVKIAKRELSEIEEYKDEIPSQTTLWKWSRQLLRQVRRHRTFVAGPRLLISTPEGRACISIYMREQIRKQRYEGFQRERKKEEEKSKSSQSAI